MGEKYTIAIPSDTIKNIGILPLLQRSGIHKLIKLKLTGTIYKPIVGQDTYRTKFFKVRHFFSTFFEVNGENIILEDLLNDCVAHNFPTDRRVNEVTFKDSNGHVFTMKRRKGNYTVSHIDGQDVANGFSKEEIMKVRKDSIFEKLTSGYCRIRKKTIQPIDYECDFEFAPKKDEEA